MAQKRSDDERPIDLWDALVVIGLLCWVAALYLAIGSTAVLVFVGILAIIVGVVGALRRAGG